MRSILNDPRSVETVGCLGSESHGSIIQSTLCAGIRGLRISSRRRETWPAKYKPGIDNAAIELSAFPESGIFVGVGKQVKIFYVIEPDAIGWDNGIETNIVRVEWGASPPGPVHGYPINERNVINECRKRNRALRAWFKCNKTVFDHRQKMNFVEWQNLLPRFWGAEVIFSYLAHDSDGDTVSSNPVGIRMPGDMLIDVEWNADTRRYTVSLISEHKLSPLRSLKCKAVNEVIAAVERLGNDAHGRYLASIPPERLSTE